MLLYHNPNTRPPEWVVEQDPDEDGGIEMTFFTGPNAEERAREYAEWVVGRVVVTGAIPAHSTKSSA